MPPTRLRRETLLENLNTIVQEDLLQITVNAHPVLVAKQQKVVWHSPPAAAAECCLLRARSRDATWLIAVLVGAHVRTRYLLWLVAVVISISSSTLMVLVLPVPGGPQMRLNRPLVVLAPLPCTAETQLCIAPACESFSPNAGSLLVISSVPPFAR